MILSSDPLHPNNALLSAHTTIPILAPCEHYAGNERFARKAFALQRDLNGAFDITLDCEDGATRGQEFETLTTFIQLALEHRAARIPGRLGVRLHDFVSSFWKREIVDTLREAGTAIAYFVIPKVRSVAEAKAIIQIIQAESTAVALPQPPRVHILIESPAAVRCVYELAQLPLVETLDFGLLDFISEHSGAIPEECMRSPGQFTHKLLVRAKTEIVAAALCAGVIPSHNPTFDLISSDAVFSDAREARQNFGFLRMWSIHPSQIEPILRAMQPSDEEIARALEILSQGHAAAWGPIRHNDQLHDRASFRYYWQLLCRAGKEHLLAESSQTPSRFPN